jgi:hypothetical protein
MQEGSVPRGPGTIGSGRTATFEASPTKGMLVAPARLGDSVHVLSRRAGAIAPALRAIAPVLLDKDATDGIRVSENTLVLDSSVNRRGNCP